MSGYKEIIEKEKQNILVLKNKVLVDFFVDIVEPEINIAYLVFVDGIYAVSGAIGSEIITMIQTDSIHLQIENKQLKQFEPYSIFLNKKIIQVRNIGEEWNGHGFEISFEGMYDKTMILQSIYTGDNPEGYDDCIRLGVGQYYYSYDKGN
ncbi:MAG: hypothetical protein K0R46_1796 [Herbinix sp.]|nr:hypothetical protein [Herbinix sp.]